MCSTPVAFGEGIWIQEQYRKKGIGKLLIQAAEQMGQRKRCQ
ncbi:MAG: GNAT family N-acetyltransferase [Deltaproteobacteria bacterium]|nr:GNAT family N-acetyltransferase [Deltaproteobacteria bacterium]